MKRIRTLLASTAGLSEYLTQDGDKASWQGFHDYDAGRAFVELRDTLVDVQRWLCGYCESQLLRSIDCQIEHVIPQSDPVRGASIVFKTCNLIACCEGGTRAKIFGSGSQSTDPERFLPPLKENMSCGARKQDQTIEDFIDPRSLPDSPPLFRVGLNGDIAADADACANVGVPVEAAENTIDFLGLNVPRLRLARRNFLAALDNLDAGTLDHDSAIYEEALRALLPQNDGKLRKFFTTSRTYFGPVAESILAEPPKNWI